MIAWQVKKPVLYSPECIWADLHYKSNVVTQVAVCMMQSQNNLDLIYTIFKPNVNSFPARHF